MQMSSTHFPSSQIITATALVFTSLGVGFYLGRQQSGSDSTSKSTTSGGKHHHQQIQELEEEGEVSEDEDEISDGDLSLIKAGFMEPCKLVLVVRTDLGMTTGKIAAQCGHATLACYKALFKKNPKLLQHWERTGQAKIALKASSEDQLLELEAIAKSLNLCARSTQDQGRTQVAEGSRTVLGIGPAPIDVVNQVTGKLRLL